MPDIVCLRHYECPMQGSNGSIKLHYIIKKKSENDTPCMLCYIYT